MLNVVTDNFKYMRQLHGDSVVATTNKHETVNNRMKIVKIVVVGGMDRTSE